MPRCSFIEERMNYKNINFRKKKLFNFFLVFLCLIVVFCFENDAVDSAPLIDLSSPNKQIVEHLRIHVPKNEIDAWIKAEKASWGPWLESQKGFLGRQIFWDPKSEDATLLISWESRTKWKLIPKSEIDKVQTIFERVARENTAKDIGNPFPLVFEGELLPQ